MPQLIAPTPLLHSSWREAHAEWGPGLHEDGFGLSPTDDVISPPGFSAWVARLNAASSPHAAAASTAPRCIYRWIVDDHVVLGGIALRYDDTAFIRRAGHIGFGIRPSSRGRGLATWALACMLDDARRVGLKRVLLVCDASNKSSAATIEHNGGLLEGIEEAEHGAARRYWIDVA